MEGIKIEYAPVLSPSTKEFANFREYIEKIENKYSKDYGMVKIRAPRAWVPRKSDYESSISKDYIPQPIEQNAYGKGGIYEMLHIVQKSMSMKEYKKRALQFDHVTDKLEVEQVEALFYKNIAFSPPIYGADARNTLFDKGIPWNLGELDCILNDGLDTLIQGVNEPFLYTGAWKTMFAWHKEDADLGAINYLHVGKPKFWYAISPEDQQYLEKIAAMNFADNFNKCSEFLRHKTTVINPYLIKKRFPQIKLHKMIQHPREFIIVFGGGYHHGFNFGFNIAEAVNYGTKNWLQRFSYAKSCKCLQDQVKINPVQFYDNIIHKFPEYKKDPIFKQFAVQLKQQGYILPEKGAQIEIQEKIIKKKSPKKSITQKIEKQEKQQKKTTKVNGDLKNTIKGNKYIKKAKSPLLKEQKQKKLPIIKKKIQKEKVTTKKNAKTNKQTSQSQDTNQNSKANKENDKPSNNSSARRRCNLKIQHANQINDCLQCDNCSKWRFIQNKKQEQQFLQKRSFYCKDIDIKCTQPQDDQQIQSRLI